MSLPQIKIVTAPKMDAECLICPSPLFVHLTPLQHLGIIPWLIEHMISMLADPLSSEHGREPSSRSHLFLRNHFIGIRCWLADHKLAHLFHVSIIPSIHCTPDLLEVRYR